MSQYLVLSHVNIQNANSIAGFTWGFPAITQFLGFTHALSRKISEAYEGNYPTEFNGCAVVSHQALNKVYQPKSFADFEFLQSKNPPVFAKHKNSSPPIIEEGKVNLTVSLVIELTNDLVLTTNSVAEFEETISSLCYKMRIAGGIVLDIANVKLLSASTQEQQQTLLRKIKRLCMPGFVLQDRSEYLEQHAQALMEESEKYSSQSDQLLLNAWLDFSALKWVAEPRLAPDQSQPNEQTNAEWKYQSKPFSGYLVPLMTGYKAISEVYEPGTVEDTRDQNTPTCFVEAVHSVGEWVSMHRIDEVEAVIWRYRQQGEWYLCQQDNLSSDDERDDQLDLQEPKANDIQQILNLF